ncbi:hypothetical protein KBB96_09065 [Luteolibacter ambystomatis]|uniref:Lipoprotein n=1 Tax=Luteolibacter ambystomatis TaxID=2824561 RepID=A0A975J2Z0_9BACT|nr:hypothetical protein [Luteolibacter ambystomatis]QUE53027.1 hypothetical protein KBB96_09065 [Luteolibacter ambystomatis]
MRALLLLPCLLATSCSLFKKGEETTAAKPGFTVFEAPAEYRNKANMLVQNDGSPAPAQGQGHGDPAAPMLPGNAKPGNKPLPGADTGYRMPDPLNSMPEDKDFRGSGQKTATNPGVTITPPKQ